MRRESCQTAREARKASRQAGHIPWLIGEEAEGLLARLPDPSTRAPHHAHVRVTRGGCSGSVGICPASWRPLKGTLMERKKPGEPALIAYATRPFKAREQPVDGRCFCVDKFIFFVGCLWISRGWPTKPLPRHSHPVVVMVPCRRVCRETQGPLSKRNRTAVGCVRR
jgi:hypothetical protein